MDRKNYIIALKDTEGHYKEEYKTLSWRELLHMVRFYRRFGLGIRVSIGHRLAWF